MVITFSNIKGSTGGGGGATGGTVSGITLWSDETTKAYIDDALSGVTDVLSAYTKTEDFATINGSAITSGGNLVIEATPYTAGTNIDITDHIISVTGISVPTKVSELVNDEGYITTADTQNFVTSGDVQTQINDSISGKADSSAVTAQISEVKAQIEAKIPSKVSDLQNDLNFASTGDVESMISGFTTSADVKTQIESYNYINSGQAQTQIDNSISGKLDTDIFTAYTANTQTELNNKQDISGMTEYATTAFTENTYAKIGNIPTKTSDLTNDSGFITDAALLGYATEQYVDNSVSGKVDNSALTQYYTSAQTDTAIQNATNGLASEEWVESQGYLKEHQSLSAYTPTSGFSTINGSAITEGGNLVIEETSYTAGANIDISTDNVISVTGITVPTKLSELTNDSGYINSEQAQTQIDNSISGKVDTNAFTAYTANTQTEIDNKQDASAMTAYATTAFTESTYLKEHQSLSAYSTTEQVQTLINTAKQEVENEIPDVSNFVTSAQVETQITDKGYLTGYTESDPVFMASPASGITTQDITNWNAKLDSSDLEPYYTSAQTDTAISNAVSGKMDTSAISAYTKTEDFATINGSAITSGGNIVVEATPYTAGTNIDITGHIISVTGITVPTKLSELTNDEGFVNSGEVETQITDKGYITGYTETDPVFMASAASGISTQDITNWNNKLESSDLEPYYTSAQTDTAISNATSGKQDTLVSGTNIKTINNQSLLGSGNIEIQGGGSGSDYSAGANIDITNNVISVTGITVPTKTSDLTNDSGFINSEQAQAQINSSISGKVDTNAFTAYTANTKTEIDNAVSVKADSSRVDEIEEVTASALVELHSTKQDTLVSGTNIKTINNQSLLGSGNIEIQGGSGSDYSAGTNIDITNNVISVTGITVPTSNTAFTNDAGYVNSGEVETQITSKGYITGYTESDPVFQASAASGISEQDITNWNNKLDSSALNPYYTSAQTDTAISNATSGKQDTLVSGTNIKTINNESLLGSGNIVIQGGSGGGSNIIEITQAEYDALTAYTEDAIYVITDAQEINIDNYVTTGDLGSYYTSAETDTAISNAVSGKTDKVSVTASSGGYKFPTWNNQGCITGTSATAYQVHLNINGSSRTLYSNLSRPLPTIYAPTSAGSAGQPLLSNGSDAPVWGAYKFQFISQSQYDALTTKDSTTIYFIVNEN